MPNGQKDDAEEKRTRIVMRPDVVTSPPTAPDHRLATEGGGFPASYSSPPEGAVIGRTRLMGDQGQPPLSGTSGAGASQTPAPTVKMSQQAKTRFIREGEVDTDPVAGWIVIVKGPGRGGFRPVFVGMNAVGRGEDQRVCLDFGDESISREEHAFITYDDEARTFYLQHGGKSNLVRLGSKPVLSPTELKPNDIFRIGNTTLRFVACCGPDFSWTNDVGDA